MRIKRSLQLWPDSANTHMYWRCHNKEKYLESDEIKTLYMKCLEESLEFKKQKDYCKIYAFCSMSNHFHLSIRYKISSIKLSNFMRHSHGLFGARYNRAQKRSGKVAEGRPKTSLIQETTIHQMNVHFYIEANPIRAGLNNLNNLHLNTFCSFGFYAYGINSKFSHLLTIPDWYLELGKTPKERQSRYRDLFKQYIEKNLKETLYYFKKFIGDADWINENIHKIKHQFLPLNYQFANTPIVESTNTS